MGVASADRLGCQAPRHITTAPNTAQVIALIINLLFMVSPPSRSFRFSPVPDPPISTRYEASKGGNRDGFNVSLVPCDGSKVIETRRRFCAFFTPIKYRSPPPLSLCT